MYRHQCDPLVALPLVCVLVAQQRHLREIIRQEDTVIPLLLPLGTKILQSVDQLLHILYAGLTFGGTVQRELLVNP